MNGYEMMADSYRQLVKQGKIDKEGKILPDLDGVGQTRP